MFRLRTRVITTVAVLFSLLVLVVPTFTSHAQYWASAQISKLSCRVRNYNVEYTFDLVINDGYGFNYNVGVWPIYSSTGMNIISNLYAYSDVYGFIKGWTNVYANYNSTKWSKLRLRIPASAFPSGSYVFYPVIEVQTIHGGVIGRLVARNCRIDTSD
jgi:hypothetical protein